MMGIEMRILVFLVIGLFMCIIGYTVLIDYLTYRDLQRRLKKG